MKRPTAYIAALALCAVTLVAQDVKRLDIDADFIVSMIADGDGGAFIGTEDNGVIHRDSDGNVTRFTAELGDPNAYALAIDKRGRLWVGNLNSGVSVFNGETWKNYDVIDGPIGERVFDIQLCPVDGDVWIATSAGITRYKLDADEWEHFTREDGLLEDQASSLAFKDDGTLIVGTQCHGLAIFTRGKNGAYTHAKNITAPERFGPNNCSPVPLVPFGDGLPTNQINQVLVASDGVIWIATPTGLVRANDKLTQMQFARGIDYADKVRGLYGGAPRDWQECPPEVRTQLLPEDYITCLAEDASGAIWLGTRQRGFVAVDPLTGRRGAGDAESMGLADNYVSAILPTPDAKPLIGLYIGGVARPNRALTLGAKPKSSKSKPRAINAIAKNNFAPLPSPIKPPTLDELKAMQAKLEKLNKPLPKIYAAYYGEDWKTQGDWIGRSFRDWAVMCAVVAPFDHPIYCSTQEYSVYEFIGPNCSSDDVIRRWIHWMQSDDRRVLWNPYFAIRRQAEWDDHGEVYPLTKDGPDLWYLLRVRHEGVFKVGMYFFNKDGHTGMNRIRDYKIEVYRSPKDWTSFYDWQKFAKLAENQVALQPPLAMSRVRDFWGGVHKHLLVVGPGNYFVKIDRNYSFNTIVSSVTIDRLQGKPTWGEQWGIPIIHPTEYNPPAFPVAFENPESRRIKLVWDAAENACDKIGGIGLNRKSRVAAYVAATHGINLGEAEKQLAYCLKWRLNQWDDAQRLEWRETMQRAWQLFYDTNEGLRKSIEGHKKGFNKQLQERFVE